MIDTNLTFKIELVGFYEGFPRKDPLFDEHIRTLEEVIPDFSTMVTDSIVLKKHMPMWISYQRGSISR